MNHPSEEKIIEWQKQKEKLRLEAAESEADGLIGGSNCCKVESVEIVPDEYQGFLPIKCIIIFITTKSRPQNEEKGQP